MASGGDSQLPQILRRRLLCSEGVESSHCYTKEAAEGNADAGGEVMGKRFSLDASDTPPTNSPRGSPESIKETRQDGQDAWKPEEEAESTDGLPDQDGDLHYDWQFELMNSMPRDKALELARVLKRSEQEKAKESAKLRQEVVELKRAMSGTTAPQERITPPPRSSCLSCRCISLVLAIFVAIFAAAMKMMPNEMIAQAISIPTPPQTSDALAARTEATETTVTTAAVSAGETVQSETMEAISIPTPPQTSDALAARTEATEATETTVTTAAVSAGETVQSETMEAEISTSTTSGTAAEPVAEVRELQEAGVPGVPVAAAPVPVPPVQPMPPVPARRQVLAAEVIRSLTRADLWHHALVADPSGVGGTEDATMKASLEAVSGSFPKITEAFRFLRLLVHKRHLDGRQVPLQAIVGVVNTGLRTWNKQTSLKLIHGLGMGCPGMTTGYTVYPGQRLDLNLQLEVPNRGQGDGNQMMRTMWVLVDGDTDEPFGPLFVMETIFLSG